MKGQIAVKQTTMQARDTYAIDYLAQVVRSFEAKGAVHSPAYKYAISILSCQF